MNGLILNVEYPARTYKFHIDYDVKKFFSVMERNNFFTDNLSVTYGAVDGLKTIHNVREFNIELNSLL